MKGTGLSYIFICEIGNVKLDCHVYDLIVWFIESQSDGRRRTWSHHVINYKNMIKTCADHII
jgi:hypothetical protein